MISHPMGNARQNSIATLLRLLIAFALLSGGTIFQSPSSCFVLAQGGNKEKNNDKNKDKNKDKDKNKNDKNKDKNKDKNNKETESPTGIPTAHFTFPPVIYETPSPTMHPKLSPTIHPTMHPTSSASEPLDTNGRSELKPAKLQAKLPKINIDITIVVNDLITFTALLLGKKDTSDPGENKENVNRVNAYFANFVTDILLVSEVIMPSSLESVDVDVNFLPMEFEDTSRTPTSRNASSGRTPVRISIAGKMNYISEDGQPSDQIDISVLEDRVSYSLEAYFAFWSTDEMCASLSEYGLTDPRITAVRVDDNLILVDADSTPLSVEDEDQDNPMMVVQDSFPLGRTAGASRKTMGSLLSFAATTGLIFLGIICGA